MHPATYTIDLPSADDAAAIGPMHLRSWIETYQNPALGVDERWIREHVGFVNSEDGSAFRAALVARVLAMDPSILYRVVHDDRGGVAGFLHVNRHAAHDEVDGIYLLRSAQGQGLGHRMLDLILQWLAASRPVRLEVVAYNQRALDFYATHGFTVVQEQPDWLGMIPVLQMERANSLGDSDSEPAGDPGTP